MNSLKQRWENFRSQARSNLVRSNSFTLQLNPSFFKDARLTNNNNNQEKSTISLTEFSGRREKEKGPYVFPTAVQHSQQKVRYIFGTTLWRRPSCLSMLQEPLRDVYLAYMTKNSSVPGIIDICPDGLRVQYAKYDGTDIEEFTNSFQSIAYWAAVQCVVRAHTLDGQNGLHIGFFPFSHNGQWLVQGNDHRPEDSLASESAFMWLAGEEHHQSLLKTEHPPLFACVMRQRASRSLRCHVFICSSSQEAIALASALYDIVKVNLRKAATSSFKRPKPSFNSKNSIRSQKKIKHKHPASFQKQKGSYISDMPPRSANKVVAANRSNSFSHLMNGLKRLTMKDLVPVPGLTHKNPGVLKPSRVRHCSSSQKANCKLERLAGPPNLACAHQKNTPPRNKTLACKAAPKKHSEVRKKPSEGSKRKCRSKFTKALENSHKSVGLTTKLHDDNWKYQVLHHSESPLPPAPPPRPRWMKLLMNLSLRHESRGKRSSVFNISRAQRHRESLRPLTSSKAQMAVVLASKGQWLNRRSDRNVMPLLTCTCNQELQHETRVSAMLQKPLKNCKSQRPAGQRSSSIDSGYIPMGSSPPKKSEDGYVEIQEAGRSRQKHKPKAPEPISVSENNLFNKQMMFAAVPCSIGTDAALDDDSDSFNSSMAISAPSIKSGSVVNPEHMCPHMANPQLVFRKLLPGNLISSSKRKYGWNLTKTSNSSKIHNPASRGAANYESSPPNKKDAEIVSILDQITSKAKMQRDKSVINISDKPSLVESIDESQGQKTGDGDSWGWATFLP